ncbi:uncharacterized protein LOC115785156 isoform X1 [Archocentrus centrarchus]|uniref:uncharacterized protein LOC115776425 n=1 Tax=Archocentrus centrarchus TaxID=63155 RepID=UPI0011EA3ADA|nr:uncharacterized protein LOC115776425 [Archocentrus centrarchus]XP_030584061.1 uncharacterized protein LOC115779503 isoform X1 [Archocentrus centrarchus]XP_030592503.1 uncharacterized protein LOC115785156 isoform X1 [Archocentrus centrarchus]
MACWRCMICFVFVALTLKSLLSHINKTHSRSPNFRVICGIDGCTEEYRVFNSFYYHIRRTHALYLATGNPPTQWMTAASSDLSHAAGEHFDIPVFSDCATKTQGMQRTDSEVNIPVIPNEMSSPELEDFQTPNTDNQEGAATASENLVRCAAAFTISVRERCHLSQRGVNSIVSGVQQYQTALLSTMKDTMKSLFQRHSDNMEQLQEAVLAELENFQDPFSMMASTYIQDSTIQRLFNPVIPEEVVMSQKVCRVNKGQSRVIAIKNRSFYYIPLIRSLEQLLSNSRIFAMINTAPQSCHKDGFLYDIIDGSIYKSHPLFSKEPSALQIILYADEIEICNPLGSHASVNKLFMFYYTLGNIDPKFRSKLAAIRLLAIAKADDIDKCGVDFVLQRINEDLKLLYNGVKIQTQRGSMDLFGAVVSVCGDTLAQHELAGFKEGVGFAYSKCRHCECTFDEMQINFNELSFTKRTMKKHIKQCCEIEKACTDFLKSSLKTTYGINRRSKLIDFPAFDLIQQTPQDIMHIILEGVAPMEIKCVLKHLVLSGQMELDVFNSAMQSFPLSPIDIRDKPCPISVTTLASNDNKLKQSSGQMLILLKIMPFLLNSIEKNEYVQFVLDLIKIVQILFAPILSVQSVFRLKNMIEQHLKQFKKLFPENNIIPKQHYLLHLPAQILHLGPVIRHMCMRFESKHCFFKQWASKLNFRNVCKSLVNHNQLSECCQNELGTEHPIFVHEKELGPVSEVTNPEYIAAKIRDFLGIGGIQHGVKVKWLILNGNKYISEKSLIITSVSDTVPVFGLIKNIFVVDSSLYCFEYQLYETVGFNTDFLAYKIVVPNLAQATEFIDAEKLVDPTSYYPVSFKCSMYVLTKYNLDDVIALKS